MNETLKKKIKYHTPEIILAVSALAGAAAVVYIAKTLQVDAKEQLQMDLPKSVISRMMETRERLLFETEAFNLIVTITDN